MCGWYDSFLFHTLLQILASEAGATLPGITQENQLAFLTQLCEAYVEVCVLLHCSSSQSSGSRQSEADPASAPGGMSAPGGWQLATV